MSLTARAAVLVLLAFPASAGTAGRAPFLEGMGIYRLAAGTPSATAQRYFDQGMVMAFGFNPQESARAFAAATREDPKCALCWWGLAWSLGPNINSDMTEEAKRQVASALAHARPLAPKASPSTRGLIDALSRRHPARGAPDAIDEESYALAMAALAGRQPGDALIALLAAESIMNLHPYDWWERDGAAKPWTAEIEMQLDRALALASALPGALHYRVHLYESSAHPERALGSADRLRDLVPGSPHLLHMPAHIYMRTGRYADATAANLRSIEADRRYLAEVDAQGAYRVGYAAHNHHFLWASAAMEGRSSLAIEAARNAYLAACGPKTGDLTTATLQHLAALQLYALVRFAKWEEILRALPPDTREPYPLAVYHFARGTAFARSGKVDLARNELARLEKVASDPALATAKVKNINTAAALAAIARNTLAAEIALATGDTQGAVSLLRAAVAQEDGLAYDEPHLWLAPTRHALGSALLAAGQPAEAAAVFREDLKHYPENGWSLHGLEKSLRAQARAAEADDVENRFRKAWQNADFALFP